MQRKRATILIGTMIFVLSIVVVLNIGTLLDLIATVATQYGEPIVGLMLCIYAGWVLNRNAVLQELKKGNEDVENGLFWKIWPTYVRYVCPAAILTVFLHKTIS